MILETPKYFTLKDLRISGIYFLFHRSRIVYIGKTTNLFNRITQPPWTHRKFDKVRIIQCESSKLAYYERRWIIRFRPKYNSIHLFKWIGNGARTKVPINLKPKSIRLLEKAIEEKYA